MSHEADVPVGYLIREMGGSTPSKKRPDYWEGEVPWVSPKDMKVDVLQDSIDHISASAVAESALQMVPERSVLIVVRGMILAHSIPVAETAAPLTINQDMKALVPLGRISGRFLRYSLAAAKERLLALVEEAGHGTRCLRSELWRKFKIAVPSLSTQGNIVSFLDRKTAAIDALIEKKERLIELLAEKRAALIHRAVTKGLNPDVPMKDSGVPWIGEIPAHWEVNQLRRQLTLQRGTDITKELQKEGIIPVVSSGGVSSFHDVALEPGPGVVVGRKGSIGTVHWIPMDYWPHDTTLYVKNFGSNNQRFVYYKLHSLKLKSFDTGSANPTLNRNLIHPTQVSWPPVFEQATLVEFLDHHVSALDRLKKRLLESLDRLREYRQALITAAVTGQLNIPEANP